MRASPESRPFQHVWELEELRLFSTIVEHNKFNLIGPL